VPHAVGGQAGTISGDGALDSSVLRLQGLVAEGNFWAQTPAASLSGSTAPLRNLDLPVMNDQFC
jgi:hypothetical protein